MMAKRNETTVQAWEGRGGERWSINLLVVYYLVYV